MPIKKTLTNPESVPVHIWTEDIDEASEQQLSNLATMPFVHNHISAMPDVHLGKGATIGSVIPTIDAIIPAAVGVDIGCGMTALKISLSAEDLPDSLAATRLAIEERVPVGFNMFDSDDIPYEAIRDLHSLFNRVMDDAPTLIAKARQKDFWARQVGTLGGGNHFIELCLDQDNQVWLMLHSGSRGIGNRIGQYYIAAARESMLKQDIHLPDKDLAFFTEDEELFDKYMRGVGFAQTYASVNRRQMMKAVLIACRKTLPDFHLVESAINCHHNYIQEEYHFERYCWVTRKGAIDASQGLLGIIPGSMGERSYIVRGQGDRMSFRSSAHGAGRRMSRTQAKKTFTEKDLVMQTMGVECRKDKSVIDEIPGAYKNIDEVMKNQDDLVEVVNVLKQEICVKG